MLGQSKFMPKLASFHMFNMLHLSAQPNVIVIQQHFSCLMFKIILVCRELFFFLHIFPVVLDLFLFQSHTKNTFLFLFFSYNNVVTGNMPKHISVCEEYRVQHGNVMLQHSKYRDLLLPMYSQTCCFQHVRNSAGAHITY